MRLRELKRKDAPLMLEWMRDESIIADLQREKFIDKTLQDCESFIKDSFTNKSNLHMAIVDDEDIYMGTVSLKNITDNDAEFAITVRSAAQRKGFAQYAMREIIRIGHDKMNIKIIYWYVRKDNLRAIRFYEKNNYIRVKKMPTNITILNNMYTLDQMSSYYWYIA